jgi:hypothetical protein
MDEADREVVYYAALLAWVGCHIDAYEQAKWYDTALKADFRRVDFATPSPGHCSCSAISGPAGPQWSGQARGRLPG